MVRVEGLEPSSLAAADFKSAVYTIPPHSQKKRWWPWVESNHRHTVFQTAALPPELQGLLYNKEIN
jgi:hypothetical protein